MTGTLSQGKNKYVKYVSWTCTEPIPYCVWYLACHHVACSFAKESDCTWHSPEVSWIHCLHWTRQGRVSVLCNANVLLLLKGCCGMIMALILKGSKDLAVSILTLMFVMVQCNFCHWATTLCLSGPYMYLLFKYSVKRSNLSADI